MGGSSADGPGGVSRDQLRFYALCVFHYLLPICLVGAFILAVTRGGGTHGVCFSGRAENQPIWWLGGRQNLPSACWRVVDFMYGSLNGEDSFHPRGFPLSPLGQAKGCSLIKSNVESMNRAEDFRDAVVEI